MDFFGHQDQARRSSRRLIVLFGIATAALVLITYLAAAFTLVASGEGGLWHPELFFGVTIGTIGLIGLASAARTAQLAAGGGALVAASMGGRLIDPSTTNDRERQLRNVVEEMAIASGVPVPMVFVLDGEAGMNAFAAGWSTRDAAIAVTRGLLENCNRDELQGVIAHEFSHVVHGDMRLNIRLMGVLFGILCLYLGGRLAFDALHRGRAGRNKNAGAIVLFALALMVIGQVGAFFGRMIQAAISRQREFLADAAAVQYTRNPHGIAMALAKIGGLMGQGRLQTGRAAEASHMLFAAGASGLFGQLQATHPPLRERIRRILPSFARQVSDVGLVAAVANTPAPDVAGSPTGAPSIAAAVVQGLVGTMDEQNLRKAQGILAALSPNVREASRHPQRALALLYALLFDASPALRKQQISQLAARDPAAADAAQALLTDLADTPRHARLPLVELVLGALRQLPPGEATLARENLRLLVDADGQVTSLEFALLKLVDGHLPGARQPLRPGRMHTLVARQRAVEVVLSALAEHGHAGDADAAAMAFGVGAAQLQSLSLRQLHADEVRLAAVDAALDELVSLTPLAKKQLLAAAAAAIASDGVVGASEGELLRAFAAHLGCPIPPVWAPDAAIATVT